MTKGKKINENGNDEASNVELDLEENNTVSSTNGLDSEKEETDSEAMHNKKGEKTNKYSNGNLEEALLEKEEEIEKKKKEIESLMDTLKRRQADFENYKKRMLKSQEEHKKLAIKDFAYDIININDDLIRATNATSDITENQTIEQTCKIFSEGVLIISKRIEETLKKYGIEEIDSYNKDFDPKFNEAVEIEISDDVDKDTITEVYQKGFKLDDYVIRCAKVKVAKAKKVEDKKASIDKEPEDKGQEEVKENSTQTITISETSKIN